MQNLDKAETPLLTQAGNPYPRGLPPVHVDYSGGQRVMVYEEDFGGVSFPYAPQDSIQLQENRLQLHGLRPGYPWPIFKIWLEPRTPDMTDKGYASALWDAEHIAIFFGQWHGLCQALSTHLGNHRTCKLGICRRKRACLGKRDEDRLEWTLAIFPPCVPLDTEIMETYIEEVRRECHRATARGEAEKAAAAEAAQAVKALSKRRQKRRR